MGKATGNGRETAVLGVGMRLEQQAEQQLLSAAAAKLKRGATLNVREMRAVRRHEERKDEERLLNVLRNCPQKILRAVFGGVQTKQLQDFQVRWDLPFARDFIDWFELGPKLWALLVRFGKQKQALDPEGELLAGASKSVRDEYVREQTRKVRLQADELEGSLVRVSELHPLLVELGNNWRRCGEDLQRRFGPEAIEIIDERMREHDRVLERIGEA